MEGCATDRRARTTWRSAHGFSTAPKTTCIAVVVSIERTSRPKPSRSHSDTLWRTTPTAVLLPRLAVASSGSAQPLGEVTPGTSPHSLSIRTSKAVGLVVICSNLSVADAPLRRITIADAIQPISTALYASRGLIPSTPALVLGGTPAIRAPADLEPSAPTLNDLHALDIAAYGFDRTVDHAFWATQGEPTVWRRRGSAVAYAYVTPDGWLGPLAGIDEASAAAAFRAELSRRSAVTVEIPGSAAELVEVAFAAGLRIVNPPGLLLHSRPAKLPTALIISGYWLL
jgi:hypothetical protein